MTFTPIIHGAIFYVRASGLCSLQGTRISLSKFCSIHFTVTLAWEKNSVRYTEDLVILRFVKTRFTVSDCMLCAPDFSNRYDTFMIYNYQYLAFFSIALLKHSYCDVMAQVIIQA